MEKWARDSEALTPAQRADLRKLTVKARQCLRLLQAHSPGPGRILDVGCSGGFFLKAAQDAGWQVEGVELNPATAAVARRTLGAEVHNLPLEKCPLPEEGFEAITAWDVIEHLSDPRVLLEAAWRALKPGGLLGLSTPNHRGLFPRLSLLAASFTGVWPHPTPPLHLYQFSATSLLSLLHRQGFEVKRVKHAVMDLDEGFGYLRHRLTNPKRMAYTLALGWSAILGPLLRRGDMIYVVAAKTPGRQISARQLDLA
jgi:2-polyprenyl-3-methyl-5-hydroxy-6-metoxy-1,4-benzoquinol methylase